MLLAACSTDHGLIAKVGNIDLNTKSSLIYADPIYACGGPIESRVWQLWDNSGRDYLQELQIKNRLFSQGDTYALYDIQIFFNNLEAMAARCNRIDRLMQMADDVMPLFDALQPLFDSDFGSTAWICRGGAVCNSRNHLVNTEVMLVSLQGLGLLSALARDLATSSDLEAQNHPLIVKTVQASLQMLRRWGGASEREQWRRMAAMTPANVTNESAAFFFTDKPMWQLIIYFNLAGIADKQPKKFISVRPGSSVYFDLSENLKLLLRFFKSRVSFANSKSKLNSRDQVADLDSGYRGLYSENRFAGYSGDAPPVLCGAPQKISTLNSREKNSSVQQVNQTDLTRFFSPPVKNLSWDLSHARRFVRFFDSLAANRSAVQSWWGILPLDMPSPVLAKAFAAQLIYHVWNGDPRAPLFSNYWNGSNGWFRVAYDIGIGECNSGYGPFGLTDSFVTGGYAEWAQYYPIIGFLGRSVYELSKSSAHNDVVFMEKNYRILSPQATGNLQMIGRLMFWPSLVR